jgi:hypothetical protein
MPQPANRLAKTGEISARWGKPSLPHQGSHSLSAVSSTCRNGTHDAPTCRRRRRPRESTLTERNPATHTTPTDVRE